MTKEQAEIGLSKNVRQCVLIYFFTRKNKISDEVNGAKGCGDVGTGENWPEQKRTTVRLVLFFHQEK